MFSRFVADKLQYYVYRLIDPRNGETFYVGKGRGSRVFEHVRGELRADDDELTEKLKRIREIRKDRFDVDHVIHRHGMTEEQAFEVEAALIDAYPEVTNQIGGRATDDRGLMHAKQIIQRYEAPEAVFTHKAVVINVNRTVADRESVYSAVHYAWKIDPKKAAAAQLVLAVERGLIIGVFIADTWLEATPENFPGTTEPRRGRWGFVGKEAPKDIADRYLGHRLPDSMRKRGAANPIRYV